MKNKNTLLAIIFIIMLGSIIFLLVDIQELKKTFGVEVNDLNSEKLALIQKFELLTLAHDSLSKMDIVKDSEVHISHQEIINLKSKIFLLLSNQKMSNTELSTAKLHINDLENSLTNFKDIISRKSQENSALQNQNSQLEDKYKNLEKETSHVIKNLENTENDLVETKKIASLLRFTYFNVKSFQQEKAGSPKETISHRKFKYFQIAFQIAPSQYIESGNKELYLVVTDPNGNIISTDLDDNAAFTLKDGSKKKYTEKIIMNYQNNQDNSIKFTKHITKPQIGDYNFQIYNNGFDIGKANFTLE